MCQDRYGQMELPVFERRTCALCFFYLFKTKGLTLQEPRHEYLVSHNNTEVVLADSRNASSRKRVCQELTSEECSRWSDCCQSAYDCCEKQLETPIDPDATHLCPRTWDGYSCWSDTEADMTVTKPCPTFIAHSVSSSKYCL